MKKKRSFEYLPPTLLLFLSGVNFAGTLPYQSLIAIEIVKIGTNWYSSLIFLSALISTIAAVAIGFVTDRGASRRKFVIFTLFCGTIGNGLLYYFPYPGIFYFVQLLMLPISGCLFEQLFALIRAKSTELSQTKADQIVSSTRSVFSLSWVVTPPVIALLLTQGMSPIGVYAICTFVCSIGFLLALFWLNEDDFARRPKSVLKMPAFRLLYLMDFRVLISIFSVGLVLGSQEIYNNVLGLFLTVTLKGSPSLIGYFSGTFALLEIPFIILVSYFNRYLSGSWLLAAGSLLFGTFLYLFSISNRPDVAFLLLFPGALANAIILSISITFIQKQIPDMLGLSTSLLAISGLVGSAASAAVFRLTSMKSEFSFALNLGCVLAFLGAILIVFEQLFYRPEGKLDLQ